MFERNRIETHERDNKTGIPVELTMNDGSSLKGRFLIPANRSAQEFLNGPATFLEFQSYQDETILMAKSNIRDIRLVGVPKAGSLSGGASAADASFDPYRILGVAKSASYDEVRDAYRRLSLSYHPDRFSTVELPDEVVSYLAAMARRVNAAYAALDEPMKMKRKAAGVPAEPRFQSGRPLAAV